MECFETLRRRGSANGLYPRYAVGAENDGRSLVETPAVPGAGYPVEEQRPVVDPVSRHQPTSGHVVKRVCAEFGKDHPGSAIAEEREEAAR